MAFLRFGGVVCVAFVLLVVVLRVWCVGVGGVVCVGVGIGLVLD